MDAANPNHMTARDAGRILDLLEHGDISAWVAGGWGVDALVGRQTRTHNDLDVLIPEIAQERARRRLVAAGFAGTLDELPTRFEMTHTTFGVVDLHPIHIDAGGVRLALPDGGWWTYGRGALDAVGKIGSRRCCCLSAREQLRLHHGYEPRDIDRADIVLLRALQAQATGSAPS